MRALRCESIRISKIIEHAIERPDTRGTRRQHDKLERKAHAVPIAGVRQVQSVGKIVGPSNESDYTIGSANFWRTKHTQRRFNHRQQRLPDTRRNCSSSIGVFNLRHNEKVAGR